MSFKAFIRQFLILGLSLISLEAVANSWKVWQSCDEQWIEAREECDKNNQYFSCNSWLPEKYQPKCEPEDKDLKRFRGGQAERKAYDAKQEEEKKSRNLEFEKVSKLIGFDNYKFSYSSDYSGNYFAHFQFELSNLSNVALDAALYSCTVSMNNGVSEIKESVNFIILPKLMSGRKGWFDTFIHQEDTVSIYTLREFGRYIVNESIPTKSIAPKYSELSCRLNKVEFDGRVYARNGYYNYNKIKL